MVEDTEVRDAAPTLFSKGAACIPAAVTSRLPSTLQAEGQVWGLRFPVFCSGPVPRVPAPLHGNPRVPLPRVEEDSGLLPHFQFSQLSIGTERASAHRTSTG